MAQSPLYEDLSAAATPERRRIAADLIYGMRAGDRSAPFIAYQNLCRKVIENLGLYERATQRRSGGQFSTIGSAALISHGSRASGFLAAIERSAEARTSPARTIVDAGTGTSAFLAVGSAVYHPHAEIFAYDVNPKAIVCAREIIRLMGLSDRVRLFEADVLHAELPEDAHYAVTETFAEGLRGPEMGAKIAEVLARSSREILPSQVRLYAAEGVPYRVEEWQLAADLKLAQNNEVISGRIMSSGWGQQVVNVFAAFYDAHGCGIVTRPNEDTISNVTPIGSVYVPRLFTPINFSYDAGPALPSYADITLG